MNPKNITVAVTMSALLALAYAGGTFNAAGNKLQVSDNAAAPIEILAPEKSAFVEKLDPDSPDRCGAKGPVTCDLIRGQLFCTDGGTCGFWIGAGDGGAVFSELGNPSGVVLDMRGGKLVALP